MNTFFYAASSYECNGECRYLSCMKRCLHALQSITALDELIVLPGGSHLKTPMSMNLRSGDLIILYAGSTCDLDELIEIKEIFEPFRVILIVGDLGLAQGDHFHLLNPRFTTTVGENMSGLNSVVSRITEVHCVQ